MNDALSVPLSMVFERTVLRVVLVRIVWVRSGIVRVTAKVVARRHGCFAKWVELYFPLHKLASGRESTLHSHRSESQQLSVQILAAMDSETTNQELVEARALRSRLASSGPCMQALSLAGSRATFAQCTTLGQHLLIYSSLHHVTFPNQRTEYC